MKRFLFLLILVPAGCSGDFNLRPHDHYHYQPARTCPQVITPHVTYSSPQSPAKPYDGRRPAVTPSASPPTIELSPPEPDVPEPALVPEKTGRIREERQPKTRVAVRGSFRED